MTILTNAPLKKLNTFGLEVYAKELLQVDNLNDLQEALERLKPVPEKMVLGGGSNVLFTQNYPGSILLNRLKGITVVKETPTEVWVRAAAGENWHNFVTYCIKNGWGGLENLSLIPGNVGASPMQNIGAYGVEIKDVFDSLEAWHWANGGPVTFSAADCAFGYRESVFKGRLKNQYVISAVTFRLQKQPVFNISYGAVQQQLEAMGVSTLSLEAISRAIISIRQSKLPDPAILGNAGSFFKNPEIPTPQYIDLLKTYPGMPGYATDTGFTKVPAGWLIEQAGWKGYREGDAGVHHKQALVLVNYGKATGQQILALSAKIIKSIQSAYGITLQPEVNIIPAEPQALPV
jgi:UDP-N-acetylmuramate dehydrogenase